jgi:hypothetical protein
MCHVCLWLCEVELVIRRLQVGFRGGVLGVRHRGKSLPRVACIVCACLRPANASTVVHIWCMYVCVYVYVYVCGCLCEKREGERERERETAKKRERVRVSNVLLPPPLSDPLVCISQLPWLDTTLHTHLQGFPQF